MHRCVMDLHLFLDRCNIFDLTFSRLSLVFKWLTIFICKWEPMEEMPSKFDMHPSI
uniref:Uncharacterized protein n=1 Tax=Ascaris lumbricoides TaxID=6252 RepID=A0A0M3HTS3_ASCLU